LWADIRGVRVPADCLFKSLLPSVGTHICGEKLNGFHEIWYWRAFREIFVREFGLQTVKEIRALSVLYAAHNGGFLPTFRVNLSVQWTGVKQSKEW
jgi:hypothetical protein